MSTSNSAPSRGPWSIGDPANVSDALVFFGATGDLAYKKIFPALQSMIRRGALNVPVIGVASASARSQNAHREQAQFHLYTIQQRSLGWHLDLEIRALDESTLSFRQHRRLNIPVPA